MPSESAIIPAIRRNGLFCCISLMRSATGSKDMGMIFIPVNKPAAGLCCHPLPHAISHGLPQQEVPEFDWPGDEGVQCPKNSCAYELCSLVVLLQIGQISLSAAVSKQDRSLAWSQNLQRVWRKPPACRQPPVESFCSGSLSISPCLHT